MTTGAGWAIDDAVRLATLRAFDFADAFEEQPFDALAAAAAALCETPVALVAILGCDQQWFKARVGTDVAGTPIELAICLHTLEHGGALVISDLASDARTATNLLVSHDPKVRFYAGVPLVLDGQGLGTLCVLDVAPRPQGLTAHQQAGLAGLADEAMALIAARRR